MIVLDTNVISELMRREPDAAVMAWLGEQPMAGVFTTTLTQAEIFYGLALLPRFLHSFRTLALLYCKGPSYIDAPDAFVLLHLALWHGSFPK